MSVAEYIATVFIPRLYEFFAAPVFYPDMLWVSVPLIVVWLVMELYLSRYSRERLGWDSAVANSLVLILVSVDLVRYLYNNYGTSIFFQEHLVLVIPLIVFVGMLGFSLLTITFYRNVPKEVALLIASPLTINFIAYFAIVVTYTNIPFDEHTTLAAFSFYLLLLAFLLGAKYIFPEAKIAENLPEIPLFKE